MQPNGNPRVCALLGIRFISGVLTAAFCLLVLPGGNRSLQASLAAPPTSARVIAGLAICRRLLFAMRNPNAANLDPINSISVFVLPDSGGVTFTPTAGAVECRFAATTRIPELLEEGEGFDCYIFSNREKMAGFLIGMEAAQGMGRNVSFAWKEFGDDLYAVAIRTPGETVPRWNDLRGDDAGSTASALEVLREFVRAHEQTAFADRFRSEGAYGRAVEILKKRRPG